MNRPLPDDLPPPTPVEDDAAEVLDTDLSACCVVPNTPAEDAAIAQRLAEALAEASPDEVDLTLRRYRDWQQRHHAPGGGRG